MLRPATSLVWLTISTLSLTAAALAQGATSPHGPQPPSAAGQPQPPALFELAQNGPRNLVDRLKAIRNNTNTTSEYGTTSRRTANQNSGSPAAPSAPAPDGTFADAQAGTPAADLPSVLVRRGNTTDPPAPITNATELSTIQTDSGTDAGTAWGTATREENSSRRTARRTRSAPTPTYRAPAGTVQSNAFHSSSRASGSQLSLSEQGPSLRVETVGPQTMAVGKPATYRIRLLNQSSVSANRVIVTATLPDSVQIVSAQSRLGEVNQTTDSAGGHRITWNVDQLSANSQQELAFDLKATENQPIDLKVDWMYRPTPLSARIEVQQPQLAVDVDGPVEMRYGDTKVFKVKLSNPGNGPAENVAVNLTATGANSEPNRIGTLAAGESRTLELELTAKEAGTMKIRATAHGDGGLQAETAHDVRIRRAALAVQVSAPGLIYAGTTATYKIRVANQGDAVAEGVIMQVDLPTGAKNGIGVDKKPITLEQPRWRIGDLSPGAQRVYSMQCELTAGGQNQLVARIQGTDESAATDSALTTVEAIADLKLIVNDPKGPVPVGQDAVYEIQVLNRGSKAATDIQLVAQFSEGIEPAAATGQRADIVPGQVVFDPIQSIPAGGEVTLKITARANQSGNLQFRAELNCGTPETKLVAQESTRFYGNAAPASRPPSVNASNVPTPARR